MKRLFFFILVLNFLNSCIAQNTKNNMYELIEDEGIFIEVFDSLFNEENRFNLNNTVYKPGNQYIYNYAHLTIDETIKHFETFEDTSNIKKGWQFCEINSNNENIIYKISLTVSYGLQPFKKIIPDYNQTVLKYEYLNYKDSVMFSCYTGLIENERNTWMHPPRSKYFSILELNPFPFIKTPFEIGNKWNWNLEIGDNWGDERWKKWEGVIKNKYTYEITNKIFYNSKFGAIECFEITSFAESKLGKSKLVAYYNIKYGFVKLIYTNIDGSKTILELIDYSEKI